jgi:hypothetical protein
MASISIDFLAQLTSGTGAQANCWIFCELEFTS